MILIVDNYDSFTYNLVQLFGEIDPALRIEVLRNDKTTPAEIADHQPTHLIISPGPCTPNEAGISVDCVRYFASKLPILGVCLGHQSIGQAFGAKIERADRLMHGKTDTIRHDQSGILAGVESPFQATRYHSLIIRPGTLPEELIECAWSNTAVDNSEIMGLRHREYPLYGLQFHPESFLTDVGSQLLKNFLDVR